jgi:hypothetical protein
MRLAAPGTIDARQSRIRKVGLSLMLPSVSITTLRCPLRSTTTGIGSPNSGRRTNASRHWNPSSTTSADFCAGVNPRRRAAARSGSVCDLRSLPNTEITPAGQAMIVGCNTGWRFAHTSVPFVRPCGTGGAMGFPLHFARCAGPANKKPRVSGVLQSHPARSTGGMYIWCPGEDSNLHEVAPAST